MDALPSLNGLRAFEAVARRGSVKAAAAELYVTPGAVSQQLKTLEQALGLTLFHRRPGGLELTGAAAGLFPVLQEAFAAIGGALQRLREHECAGPLTVSVIPSFASKWLVPRLGKFRQLQPEIDVRISATTRRVDLAHEDVDVAIRLGSGDYPDLASEFLFREPMFPVCSPALSRRAPTLRKPADLKRYTLLHDEGYGLWKMWLELHKVTGVDAGRGPVFSDAAMALQAAMDGQGVAMARGELVAQDLAERRLIRLFDLAVPYQFAYYLVSLPAVAEWPKVAAFRNWLLEEARRFRGESDAQAERAGGGGARRGARRATVLRAAGAKQAGRKRAGHRPR